jgi:hypothetical protein
MDAMDEDDIAQVVRVWREAMNATHRYWRDEGKDPKTGRAKGCWITEPDHKTRIAAANIFAAYKEGLPIQRQVNFNMGHEELRDVIEKAKKSPAALEALRGLGAMTLPDDHSSQTRQNVMPETAVVEKNE